MTCARAALPAVNAHVHAVEWPTLTLIIAVHGAWIALTLAAATLGWLVIAPLAVVIALHSSLQHEVAHGHPLRSRRLSEALVWLPLGLAIPYERFRDTHLAHHRDERLTDPHDDPESNYFHPAVWSRLPWALRGVLAANNTLAGRILLGPAIGMACFLWSEAKAAWAGEGTVRRAWAMHAAGLAVLIVWLAVAATPWWVMLAGAYGGLSILRIRTFLEHRAHEKTAGRSVVIERGGVLGFLFLNNNLHALHHAAPRVAWYRLPALWRVRRGAILKRNRGYRFDSYAEVFQRFFLRAKDPVAHPLIACPDPVTRRGRSPLRSQSSPSVPKQRSAHRDAAPRSSTAAEREDPTPRER
ncbi:MAG: fatty acid desaturase [Pseudomonadota bacterium]